MEARQEPKNRVEDNVLPFLKITPEMMESMNIGVRYWGTKLDELPEVLKNAVNSYLSTLHNDSLNGQGMYLHGNIHHAMGAASVVLKAFRRHKLSGFCVSASDVLDWIFERRETDDNERFKDYFEEVDLLVIWGLNADRRKDADTIFKNLVLSRHFKMKPTIWVTSLAPEQLASAYPREIAQTISQNCVCVSVD